MAMEIVIGREEGARRLHCIAGGREFNVGQAGMVPLSVSRRHCKITVNGGNITIENIKAQNVTYVDDNQIFSKSISPTSRVQLGEEKFLVPLQQILQMVGVAPTNASTPQKEAPTYSLKPLERVWKEYDDRRMEIQVSQQTTLTRHTLHAWCVHRPYSRDGFNIANHYRCRSLVHRCIFLHKGKCWCYSSATVARP